MGGRGHMSGARRAAAAPEDNPETFFGAKVVEWWRADLGIDDAGAGATVVDSWTGQKRGIVLSAAAAANRCVLDPASASFNGQPTVITDTASTNWLRNLAISPALFAVDTDIVILAVQRYSSVYDAGNEELLHFSNAGGQMAKNGSRAGVGAITGFVVQTAFVSAAVVVTETDPALIRVQRERAAPADCFLIKHNSTTNTDSEAGTDLTGEIDRMAVGAQTGGVFISDTETAEIVLLDSLASAGELSDYEAYTLARYGVPT